MVWKDIYTQARIKYGRAPNTKDDYYAIMYQAINSVNADEPTKAALRSFLKPYAFTRYKAASTYKWASILPPMFIQWLAERENRTITLADLEFPNITAEDVVLFSEDWSPSVFVHAQVRAYLIQFGKFITSGRYPITKYPFIDLKVDMPVSRRIIVYNPAQLDELYNTLLFSAPGYLDIFYKVLIQTGLRPLHAYYLTCGDIGYDKPQKDALDRTFYPILAREVLDREKRKIKETVFKKVPAQIVYISESLKNEIVKWCDSNKLTGKGYIFKDFVRIDAFDEFIRRRRTSPTIAPRLKFKDTKYILYGLRHTWTSTVYALTKDVGDLIDLGGWSGANVPLSVYRVSMKACDALNIAKKWELYLPPDKTDEILEIQARCEHGAPEAVPGAPIVTVADLEGIRGMIDSLQKQLTEERENFQKLLAEERAKREALERSRRR